MTDPRPGIQKCERCGTPVYWHRLSPHWAPTATRLIEARTTATIEFSAATRTEYPGIDRFRRAQLEHTPQRCWARREVLWAEDGDA